MKKLMVILGAALMCSAASAATVLWSTSETFSDADGVAFAADRNITAYLFDASIVSQSALFDSWNTTGTADVSGAKVTSTWYDAYQLDVSSQVGEGTKSLYWAVINGDELFVSSSVTKEISAIGQTDFDWGVIDESGSVYTGAESFSGAGWYVAGENEDIGGGDNVPEPTSGLLLLIGVAGLALRRKQA